MIFTEKQIRELLRMIEFQHTFFIAGNVSAFVLTDHDKELLKSFGIDWEKFTSELTPFQQEFYFGRLAAILGAQNARKVTYNDLKKYIRRGQYVPLSRAEQEALRSLETKTYNYIQGLSQNISTFVENKLLDVNLARRDYYESVIRDATKRAIVERESAKSVMAEIGKKTGDWKRDLGRIAETEMQNAYETGKALAFKEVSGARVKNLYKQVYPGACRHCIRLFLTDGIGSEPQLFSYEELAANGTNVGRKPENWLPVLGTVHPFCYDDKTEVLTDQGWKFFKDLNKTERFLSVRLEDGDAEWVKAVNWVDQFYEGKMFLRKNKTFSLCTTPNHSHAISSRSGLKYPWVLSLKEEGSFKKGRFLRGIPSWKGEYRDKIRIENFEYNVNDFCEFLGYYLSEGSVSCDGRTWRVNISQMKESRYKMLECCKRLFGDKCSLQKERIEIYINENKRPLWYYLQRLGHSGDKYIPWEIKNLPIKQLSIFLDAFALGDGTIHRATEWRGYKFRETRSFSTSSEQLVADLSELLLKVGKRPSFMNLGKSVYNCKKQGKSYISKKDQWVINECRFQYSEVSQVKSELIDYSGYIYDVELERNHTLIVRREGKVCVSGNCRCDLRIKRNPKDIWNDKKGIFEPAPAESKIKSKGDIKIVVGDKTFVV